MGNEGKNEKCLESNNACSLYAYGAAIPINTSSFTFKELAILSTHYKHVYVFCMILIINNFYFLEEHKIGLRHEDGESFLPGWNMLFFFSTLKRIIKK
jgi:hypothetical protein